MSNYDYALYCRGFLFSDELLASPKKDWKCFEFAPRDGKTFYVSYDKKNEISYYTDNRKWCFIVGMAMDTVDWHMELDIICKNCVRHLNFGLTSFYEYIDNLNGRFAMFFGDEEKAVVLNDAAAMRSVYYHEKRCIISSHYEIIAEQTLENHHPYMEVYNSIDKQKPWMLPGDMTPYEHIRILTANHELDLDTLSLRRFYPRANHKKYSLKEILSILPTHLNNQMNTLARYHTPIISVTRGNDSRVTMAASKDVRHKAVYFTFANQKLNENDLNQLHRQQDCDYAKYICELYGLNFKPLVLKPPVDPEMSRIVKRNNYHQHIVSAIPEYLDNLPNGVHIQSNLIEIVRDLTYVYSKPPRNGTVHTDQEIMAGWMMYWSRRHEVIDYVNNYWDRNQWDDIYDYERVRLFYWEHRMSTWISVSPLFENDWAFNTYLLFNCRKLLEMGFCIPKYVRDKNFITKYTVHQLWPELLYRIENSDDTLFDYFEVDPCGKLPIKGHCRVESNHKGRTILTERMYGAMLGFDLPILKKDDFCEIIVDGISEEHKNLQITLSAPENSWVEKKYARVYVKVNSQIVKEDDLFDLFGCPTVLNITTNESVREIAIGLRCQKEINCEEYGNYVIVNLDSIYTSNDKLPTVQQINI